MPIYTKFEGGARAEKNVEIFQKMHKKAFFDLFFFPQLCLRRRNFWSNYGGLYSDLGESEFNLVDLKKTELSKFSNFF